MTPGKLVLLDRDGVMNHDLSPHGVTAPEALVLYPNTAPAIRLLRDKGWNIAVVTNQSAIGKGLLTEAGLHAIHQRMQDELAASGAWIDRIYYCPDAPNAPTHRRKPGDGMLREALRDFQADPSHTPLIGDALRDLQAAASAECPRYLVATGKGAVTREQLTPEVKPVTCCEDILDAARQIIVDFPHGMGS